VYLFQDAKKLKYNTNMKKTRMRYKTKIHKVKNNTRIHLMKITII